MPTLDRATCSMEIPVISRDHGVICASATVTKQTPTIRSVVLLTHATVHSLAGLRLRDLIGHALSICKC